jgi:hypothetical protein
MKTLKKNFENFKLILSILVVIFIIDFLFLTISLAFILIYQNLTIILDQSETNFSVVMVKFYRFLSEIRSVLWLCFSLISIGFLSIKKMNFFMFCLKWFEWDILEKIWDSWDSFKKTNKINTNALKRLTKDYKTKKTNTETKDKTNDHDDYE